MASYTGVAPAGRLRPGHCGPGRRRGRAGPHRHRGRLRRRPGRSAAPTATPSTPSRRRARSAGRRTTWGTGAGRKNLPQPGVQGATEGQRVHRGGGGLPAGPAARVRDGRKMTFAGDLAALPLSHGARRVAERALSLQRWRRAREARGQPLAAGPARAPWAAGAGAGGGRRRLTGGRSAAGWRRAPSATSSSWRTWSYARPSGTAGRSPPSVISPPRSRRGPVPGARPARLRHGARGGRHTRRGHARAGHACTGAHAREAQAREAHGRAGRRGTEPDARRIRGGR